MSKHGPRLKIGGRWVAHQDTMTSVLRELSPSARRILDTLEIEHCRHRRLENGRLVCTYTDLARYVPRSRISSALRELVSAGLIEITRPGRRAYANLRTPSLYRLTFEPTYQDGKAVAPTHDWKKQKARPESDTGARPESDTGNGQKPGRNPTLREGKSQAGIRYCLSRSGVDGWGIGGTDDTSKVPPPPPPTSLTTGSSIVLPSGGTLQ
jgi:hypothetical protein